MEITISEKHLAHFRRLIDSGRYYSADAVVARALALLEERDLADKDPDVERELAEIRGRVLQGIDDLQNGRSTKYESREELIEEIRRRGIERRDRRKEREARTKTELT